MKELKTNLYWTLMPPFLLVALVLLFFLPDNNPYIFGVVILFWVTYYCIRYVQKKKSSKD
ncbi:hypothetical protein [Alkalihalobacillus sp. 1P02AB]|uniref:hypothetical protein n=1 Tax=Alkalihalobacillus sp. 1P02AB TaxID=3132260 RepID=UPI0039A70E15